MFQVIKKQIQTPRQPITSGTQIENPNIRITLALETPS